MCPLQTSRHEKEGLHPRRPLGGGRDQASGGTCSGLKGRAQQTGMMRVNGPDLCALTGQMQMDGERNQPARDSDDRERNDWSLDSACEVHSCAVHGFVLDAMILYPRSCAAPA
jgi:hypothetical protein